MKNGFLTAIIIGVFSFKVNAQLVNSSLATKGQIIRSKEYIYTAVDVSPKYKSGDDKFYQYLLNNIKKPNGTKGLNRIIIAFVVERDGRLSNSKILKSSGNAEFDAELLRVVKASPKWNPGYMNGKPVRVQYSVPMYLETAS